MSGFRGLLQSISIIGIIASLRYIPSPVMITIVFSHTLMLVVIGEILQPIQYLEIAVVLSSLTAFQLIDSFKKSV